MDDRYLELVKAIHEQREAEERLRQCVRRVEQLAGITRESEQRKLARNTLSRKDFVAGMRS